MNFLMFQLEKLLSLASTERATHRPTLGTEKNLDVADCELWQQHKGLRPPISWFPPELMKGWEWIPYDGARSEVQNLLLMFHGLGDNPSKLHKRAAMFSLHVTPNCRAEEIPPSMIVGLCQAYYGKVRPDSMMIF